MSAEEEKDVDSQVEKNTKTYKNVASTGTTGWGVCPTCHACPTCGRQLYQYQYPQYGYPTYPVRFY